MSAKSGRGMIRHTVSVIASIAILALSGFSTIQQHDYLVEISVVSKPTEGELIKETYKSGEKVQVKVTMTNVSTKTMNVPKGEDYYRPHLVRDGHPVAYRKEVAARIQKQEKGGSSRITGFLFLRPNEPQSDLIDLDYWFKPLRPGRYQLSVRRIFFKQRADSKTIFFKVLPVRARKPSMAKTTQEGSGLKY